MYNTKCFKDTAVFNTKFAEDIEHNGEKVKILDYISGKDFCSSRYRIQFPDGKVSIVYAEELIF